MLLTDQERQRFVDHCRRESHDFNLLVEQAGKLTGMALLIQRYKNLAIAYGLVARHLDQAESQTIDGGT